MKKKRNDWERVATLYKEGNAYRDIAEELNIPLSSVAYIVRNSKVKIRSVRTLKNDKDLQRKARQLYESGKSYQKVAEEMGFCKETIKELVKCAGGETRSKRTKYPQEYIDEIGDLFVRGISLEDLAKKYGLSKKSLKWALHHYGWSRDNYTTGCGVVQMDLQGNVIAEFNSQVEASRQTGVTRFDISRCCRNLIYQAGGFKWMKLKDYLGIS